MALLGNKIKVNQIRDSVFYYQVGDPVMLFVRFQIVFGQNPHSR